MINGSNLRTILGMSESRWRLSKEHGLVIDGAMVCTPHMVCANGIIIENNPGGSSYLRLTIRMNEQSLVDPESYESQGH